MVSILQSLSKTIHISIALSILLFLGLYFGNGGFDFDLLFWSWLFILCFPISIGVFIWSEIWIGILILFFAYLVQGALRKNNCECIIMHSLDNEEFFYLVLEKEVIKIVEV